MGFVVATLSTLLPWPSLELLTQICKHKAKKANPNQILKKVKFKEKNILTELTYEKRFPKIFFGQAKGMRKRFKSPRQADQERATCRTVKQDVF